MRSLDEVNFEEQHVEFFSEVMARCRADVKKLLGIETQKEIGIILLNSKTFSDKVIKKSEELTHRIHQNIPRVLEGRSTKLLKEIRENYDLVGTNPRTIKDYITFLKNTTVVNTFF